MIYANQDLQARHGKVKISADYHAVNQRRLAYSKVALRSRLFPQTPTGRWSVDWESTPAHGGACPPAELMPPGRVAGGVCKEHIHSPKNVVTAPGDDNSCSRSAGKKSEIQRELPTGAGRSRQRCKDGAGFGPWVACGFGGVFPSFTRLWPGAEVAGGVSGSSGEFKGRCPLLQGSPGQDWELQTEGDVHPSSKNAWVPFLLLLLLAFGFPCPQASVRCPGIRHGADGSPGPAELPPTFLQRFQRPSRNQINAFPCPYLGASGCGQSRAWAQLRF